MSDTELKLQILSEHIEKLDKLKEVLEGVGVVNDTLSTIEVIATDKKGKQQSLAFDCNELDTLLLFQGLSDLAKTRSDYLKSRAKELSEYV